MLFASPAPAKKRVFLHLGLILQGAPTFGDAWEFENILKTLNNEKLIDIITYQTLLYNAMSKPELEHFKKIDFFNSQLSFFIDLCPLRATKL